MPWQTSSQLKALPNCSSQRWRRQMGTQSSSAPSSAFVLQGRGCGAQPACTTAALPRDRSTNCSHQNCCSPLTDQLNSQCAKAHALISEDSPSPGQSTSCHHHQGTPCPGQSSSESQNAMVHQHCCSRCVVCLACTPSSCSMLHCRKEITLLQRKQ